MEFIQTPSSDLPDYMGPRLSITATWHKMTSAAGQVSRPYCLRFCVTGAPLSPGTFEKAICLGDQGCAVPFIKNHVLLL